jgi:type IV pilus assembly protein PilF
MKLRASIAALALLAGCAGGGAPSPDSGTIVSDVGDPRNRAKLHTELAGAYYSRGSMGVALEELRTAVASDPGYAPAYGMFGVVYMELRENQLAQKNFEQALRLAPEDPDINHNFGWFLCQTKREPDSIKYFLQAVRNPLYPMPQRSYSAAGQCSLRTNNLKDAEEFSQRALKLDPDDPPSLMQMGHVRYRQGRVDEARRLVSRYNKLVAPNAESLWLALRIERKSGQRTAETSYATQLRRHFAGSEEYKSLQRGEYD